MSASLNTHGTNNTTTHNLVGGNLSDDLGKEAGHCTSTGIRLSPEIETTDKASQLQQNIKV